MTRDGLMWQAAARGNIKLRECEKKEYEKMKAFIRDNPGCTQETLKKHMGTWRVGMFLAYGEHMGDLRGDQGHPEKWWRA